MIALVLSALLVLVIALLGWILLPFLSMIITVPVMLGLRPVNKLLAYMVSRYLGFAFDIAALAFLIGWSGAHFDLVTWPAWIAAGWCMFAAGNTLILFDIRCYLSDSGAWANWQSSEPAAQPTSE